MRKQRVLYLLVLLFSAAAAFFYWDYIAVVLLIVVLAAPALLFVPLLIARPFISVQFEETAEVTRRGREVSLHILAENRSFIHLTRAIVTLTLRNRFGGPEEKESFLIPIAARNRTTLTVSPVSAHCGEVTVSLSRLKLCDWLGITSLSRKGSGQVRLAVLPELFTPEGEPPPAEAPNPEGTRYSAVKQGDDFSQVFDYHEYREGDRIKDIQWKLSARLDRLIVKEGSLPLASAVCVAVDCVGGELDGLDMALEAAVSVSSRLLELGLRHDFLWLSPEEGLRKFPLATPEELFDALQQFYQEEHFSPPGLLAEELAAVPGESAYAQMYYTAVQLTEQSLPAFGSLADRMRLTLLFDGDEAIQKQLDGEGIRSLRLAPGATDSLEM